jgi:hypothetical protein
MTPKEKAIELVQKYFITVEVFYKQDSIPNILKAPMTRESVKQCALIAVDEMIIVYKSCLEATGATVENAKGLIHLEQIKQEIEKL